MTVSNVYDLAMFPWLDPASASTGSRLAAVRDTSLYKLVRDDLLERILGGELRPGDRISEPDVGARLSVSRVPVREALRELESSGLVVSRKHAGVFVRRIEPAEVQDLYEMRALLDGFAGEKAAALPVPVREALVRVLAGSIATMDQAVAADQVRDYYTENLRFHWLIVEAAGNQSLRDSYRELVQKLHLSRLRSLSRGLAMQTSIQEHQQIVRAIESGDPAAARRLLARHVGDAHRRLSAADPQGQTASGPAAP